MMEKNLPKETAGHLSLFPTLFLNLSDFMPSLKTKVFKAIFIVTLILL